MPWNGSGTFAPLGSPEYPAVSGEIIYADYFNAIINDLITGLNNCVTRDYQEGDFWLNFTDPDKGAALVGYGEGVLYGVNTVGDALNSLFDAEKDLVGTANQLTVTETDADTLTLSFPSAVTFPGTARSVGVTDGSNAGTGYVGEYLESEVDVTTALTSATNTDLTSIALPAGDYLLGGSVIFDPSSAFVFTYLMGWLNVVATTPGGANKQALVWGPADGTALPAGLHAVNAAFPLPLIRLSLASAQTLYLGAKAVFSAGTVNAGGKVWALRIR